MAESCLLYYITDRTAFPGDERTRRHRLLDKIAEAATHGVNYIQLREKDLLSRDLESLAREAMRVIREHTDPATGNSRLATALLVNSRTDVALAIDADGVHLRADDISAEDLRTAWKSDIRKCGAGTPPREFAPPSPVISTSCHSLQEVTQAAASHAALALFGPVFEKKDAPGTNPAGLEVLRQACRANIPILALGGITLQNVESCLRAGAAGIAAIRLFQENDIAEVVRQLRA